MCSKILNNEICSLSINCGFAHNKVEQQFHPLPWKSSVCDDSPSSVLECPRIFFCPYRHFDDERYGYQEVLQPKVA